MKLRDLKSTGNEEAGNILSSCKKPQSQHSVEELESLNPKSVSINVSNGG